MASAMVTLLKMMKEINEEELTCRIYYFIGRRVNKEGKENEIELKLTNDIIIILSFSTMEYHIYNNKTVGLN